MMRIDIITIFPDFFAGPLGLSIPARAQNAGVVEVECHDLRDYTDDAHRTVDDAPYGGGPGMVMKPEPLFRAIRAVRGHEPCPVICFTPQGRTLDQRRAEALARERRLIMICGRYEGIDERVRETLVTDEISIGDYVLSGGEPAALVTIDAVVRLVPGALGNQESHAQDSFSDGLLEHPHYTRPPEFEGKAAPEELVTGDHAAVRRWRRRESLRRTYLRRPDLLAAAQLSKDDHEFLAELASAKR